MPRRSGSGKGGRHSSRRPGTWRSTGARRRSNRSSPGNCRISTRVARWPCSRRSGANRRHRLRVCGILRGALMA